MIFRVETGVTRPDASPPLSPWGGPVRNVSTLTVSYITILSWIGSKAILQKILKFRKIVIDRYDYMSIIVNVDSNSTTQTKIEKEF